MQLAAQHGTLAFSLANSIVAESAGSASFSVTRSGGTAGAVSVNYATANGTAQAGIDYTAVTNTLFWADGDAGPKLVTVPVLDRKLTQGSTNLLVSLSQPTGGAALGSPSQATLTIADNGQSVATIQAVNL